MVAKAEETGTPVRPLEHSAEETLATGLPQSRLRPSTGDVIFFIVLLAALTGVALSARVAWREASLMEHAKAQAQTLHRWAVSVASDPDSTEPVPPTICAPLSGEPGEGPTLMLQRPPSPRPSPGANARRNGWMPVACWQAPRTPLVKVCR